MPPGRRSTGGSTEKSTIVDSRPMSVGPPSRIRSTRPSRSSFTCAAVVGLGREKRFALGAAIGTPAISISARATRCDGARSATFGKSGGDEIRNRRLLRKNQRERPGPERQRELARGRRERRRALRHLADVRDVHDQRIGGRPFLRVEDLLHGGFVECVRTEAVDGFGGKRDEFAVANRLRPLLRSPRDPAAADRLSGHGSSCGLRTRGGTWGLADLQDIGAQQQLHYPTIALHAFFDALRSQRLIVGRPRGAVDGLDAVVDHAVDRSRV